MFCLFGLLLSIISSANTLEHCLHQYHSKHLPIRFHLGCGENHLNEYINIDFPLSEHTAQKKSGADMFADIRTLECPKKIVDEVRLHHLFEHFDRATALALLCNWHEWLKKDGILYIETPDGMRCIQRIAATSYTYPQKQILLRHLFGSHEANWACHWDAWYDKKYKHILPKLGFEIIKIEQHGGFELPNITIHAKKTVEKTRAHVSEAVEVILSESLVDRTPGELGILEAWMNIFLTYYHE